MPLHPLQPSFFWTQQPCPGPCLSLLHRFLINNCPLGSHRPYSVQCHSCTVWEHNARELGCFCLNLSWTSFSNLSELLICRAGTSGLPSNQCCCPTCYFHSCALFPPCIILPALPPSLQTAFLFLSSSPLSSLLAVQTINSHHPSASDNCTNHKQVWFSL